MAAALEIQVTLMAPGWWGFRASLVLVQISQGSCKLLDMGCNPLGMEAAETDSETLVGGALDAKGSSLRGCKAKGNNCPAGATVLCNCCLI